MQQQLSQAERHCDRGEENPVAHHYIITENNVVFIQIKGTAVNLLR